MSRNDLGAIVPNPEVDDYRDINVAIEDAFLWRNGLVEPGIHYVVEFGSYFDREVYDSETDLVDELHDLDGAAHAEAAENPDLERYFPDRLSAKYRTRSHCVWKLKSSAIKSMDGDAHTAAVEFLGSRGRMLHELFWISKNDVHVTEDSDLVFVQRSLRVVTRGRVTVHTVMPDVDADLADEQD